MCDGGERWGGEERKEAVAFPAATGERHVSFSYSLQERLRTAGESQRFPCMRKEVSFQLQESQVLLLPQCDRYAPCSTKKSSDALLTKGPFHWETISQGSSHLQNKPRSRPQREVWLQEPEMFRVTDAAESEMQA